MGPSRAALFVAILCLAYVVHAAERAADSCPNGCSGHGTCHGGVCHCLDNWAGDDCSFVHKILSSGGSFFDNDLPTFSWAYFTVLASHGETLQWNITQTGQYQDGDCDVYINRGTYPTRSVWVRRDISTDRVVIINQDNVEPGQWHAGVYGFLQCSFQITVTVSSSCPLDCSGHGQCINGVCQCNSGYSGPACDQMSNLVVDGPAISGTVQQGLWQFYQTQISHVPITVNYTLAQTTDGDADIYVSFGSQPSTSSFIASNTTMALVSTVTIELLQTGTYYAGIVGFWGTGASHSISYELSVATVKNADCSRTSNCSGPSHGHCTSSGGCQCVSPYSGADCEEMTSPMGYGESNSVQGFVNDDLWNYYHVIGTEQELEVHVLEDVTPGDSDCDVYISAGKKPTLTDYDYVSLTTSDNFTVSIEEPLGQTWYIGVYGWSACSYTMWVAPRTDKDCGPNGSWDDWSDSCVCNDGWTGDSCEIKTIELTNGVSLNGSVPYREWAYYYVNVEHQASSLEVRMKEMNQNTALKGTVWLYMSESGYPTLFDHDQADYTTDDLVHSVSYAPSWGVSGTYFIGVYGSPYGKPEMTNNFTIVAWAPDFK